MSVSGKSQFSTLPCRRPITNLSLNVVRDKFVIDLQKGKVLNSLLAETDVQALNKALDIAQVIGAASTDYGIGDDVSKMATIEQEVINIAATRRTQPSTSGLQQSKLQVTSDGADKSAQCVERLITKKISGKFVIVNVSHVENKII